MSTIQEKPVPVVEAYIGEYASGKSENAVNRALALLEKGRQVVLADLDLVEPFYTLRPLKKMLTDRGLQVLTWDTEETVGLGEAGYPLRPEVRWVLRQPGDIIIDCGYGIEGTRALNLLAGVSEHPSLKVLAVVNAARPVTGTEERIVEFVAGLGRVDGLLNNTHLGEETSIELVQEGAAVVTRAAGKLGVKVIATCVVEELSLQMGKEDCMGNPIRSIKRYMPEAFW